MGSYFLKELRPRGRLCGEGPAPTRPAALCPQGPASRYGEATAPAAWEPI